MSDHPDTRMKTIQLDPPKLIKAIRKRKMLYDKDDPNYYHNKRQKTKCWQEVCLEIVPKWEELKSHERIECCHEVQRRWKSLRTCFRREIGEQQKEVEKRKNNLPMRRRKTYGYYKMMKFLLPYCSETNNDIEQEKVEANESENYEGDDQDDNNTEEENDPLDNSIKDEFTQYTGTSKQETILEPDMFQQICDNENEGKVTDFLKDMKKEEHDDDKQFLMSLIPTFKKFNDKQKLEARIEILKVLKDISFKHDCGASSSTN